MSAHNGALTASVAKSSPALQIGQSRHSAASGGAETDRSKLAIFPLYLAWVRLYPGQCSTWAPAVLEGCGEAEDGSSKRCLRWARS